MQRIANQQDLARAAGVSVSTVSRALSNSPGISAEMRTQIQRLAEELGYKSRGSSSDEPARTVRTYVTTNAVNGGLATFYNTLIEAMNEAAREVDLTLEIRLIHDRALDIPRIIRDASPQPAVATLIMGIDPSAEVLEHYDTTNPLILVNTFDPLMRFDCVAPNNFYGAYWATHRLLTAGHRSLVHVRDQLRWTTLQRERGFFAALADFPGAHGTIVDCRDGDEKIHAAIADRKVGKTNWTGLFCVHDMAAVRIIHALEAAQYRVPDDVSVIGFDDLPAAAMMTPRLSTMRVDCASMGREAIALVNRRLANPQARPVQVECAVEETPGGTVAQIS